jgi:hypothetical protein
MNDEEVAFRIVRLYFEEIARLGFKRQLDLDQIINAYFYSLKRLGNKDEEIKKAVAKIMKEESAKSIEKDVNKVTSSQVETSKTTVTNASQAVNLTKSQSNDLETPHSNNPNVKTTTQTKERTITDILEGK